MKLTVLGAGCWGSTLVWLLSNNFEDICLWGREEDLSEELKVNKHCLKPFDIQLDKKVEVTSDLKAAIENADIILSVIATSGTRDVCEKLKQAGIKNSQILVNASKGLELPSLKTMAGVIKDVLPEQKLAILSGPTLAKEVLNGCPTAACVASEDMDTAKFVQEHLNVKSKFRLYTNSDVIGVELGGSLKNVIAIASGFASEMHLGDNCRGALLTRGMAEIVRVSVQLGANYSTLYGLSGMGDLMSKARIQSAKQLYKIEPVLKQQKSQKDVNDLLNTSVQMILIDNVKTENILESAAKKWDRINLDFTKNLDLKKN